MITNPLNPTSLPKSEPLETNFDQGRIKRLPQFFENPAEVAALNRDFIKMFERSIEGRMAKLGLRDDPERNKIINELHSKYLSAKSPKGNGVASDSLTELKDLIQKAKALNELANIREGKSGISLAYTTLSRERLEQMKKDDPSFCLSAASLVLARQQKGQVTLFAGDFSYQQCDMGNKIAAQAIKGAIKESISRCQEYSSRAVAKATGINRYSITAETARLAIPKWKACDLFQEVKITPEQVKQGNLPYGTVVVGHSVSGNPAGHTQIWTPKGWVSDTKQSRSWVVLNNPRKPFHVFVPKGSLVS
jgi:hypothetical protein